MGYEDRPPADAAELCKHLQVWQAGDELPGRTLANLKTGRLDDVLVVLAADGLVTAEVTEAWESWERGTGQPADVLEAIVAGGLIGVLETFATA